MSVYGEGNKIIKAITATTYRATKQDLGAIITNRAAGGNLALTLPPTIDLDAGWWCEVFCVAAGTVTVASDTTDTIVAFNDATADSIAFSTASEIIGNGLTMVWDGTGWLAFMHLGIETATPVIAT